MTRARRPPCGGRRHRSRAFYSGAILTIGFSQWAAVLTILVALFMPIIAKALDVRR